MTGQWRILIRREKPARPWFDYQLVSKKEVEEIVCGTGGKIKQVIESKGPALELVIVKVLTGKFGERSG